MEFAYVVVVVVRPNSFLYERAILALKGREGRIRLTRAVYGEWHESRAGGRGRHVLKSDC